jgi:hypothetical protein
MSVFPARIVAAVTTALVLAACGEPTASVTAPPDKALNDGGYTFGGGNRSDSTTTAPSGGGAVANSGGYTFGGGN